MLNKLIISFLLIAIAPSAFATIKSDSLLNILKSGDTYRREKLLVAYIRDHFQADSTNRFHTDKMQLDEMLSSYKINNSAAYDLFIESIYYGKILNWDECVQKLIGAIEIADQDADHYLIYTFLTNLAFVRTNQGEITEAMSCFRLAKKEAGLLRDNYLQVIVDINISDLSFRNNFYRQSIFYLDEAQRIMVKNKISEQRLINVIYYNKAENYFRIKNTDSLNLYNKKLHAIKDGTFNINTFRSRTDYYILSLMQRYRRVINSIKSLKESPWYEFDDQDQQNLADAYFNDGQADSAKDVINHLLNTKNIIVHPEIKAHLYHVLGEIDEKLGNSRSALANFKKALQESEDRIGKLAQVGNVSSEMRIDEMQDSIAQKDRAYQRERTWFLFTTTIAALTVGILVLVYRNVKQKRHYERLLYTAQKEELAFLNSHEVRKHLSNILGLLDAMQHSENRQEDYQQFESRLFYSAQQLDNAIRNIGEKLNT